jgi:hypothetical protein
VLNPATVFFLLFGVCALLLLTAADLSSRGSRRMWPSHGAMEPHTPFLRDNLGLGALSQSSATPILTHVSVLISNALSNSLNVLQ